MNGEDDAPGGVEDEKPVRPNLIGVVTGIVSLPLLAVTHFTFGFPDMLIHVLMFPVLIGLLTRWWIRQNFMNPYRED